MPPSITPTHAAGGYAATPPSSANELSEPANAVPRSCHAPAGMPPSRSASSSSRARTFSPIRSNVSSLLTCRNPDDNMLSRRDSGYAGSVASSSDSGITLTERQATAYATLCGSKTGDSPRGESPGTPDKAHENLMASAANATKVKRLASKFEAPSHLTRQQTQAYAALSGNVVDVRLEDHDAAVTHLASLRDEHPQASSMMSSAARATQDKRPEVITVGHKRLATVEAGRLNKGMTVGRGLTAQARSWSARLLGTVGQAIKSDKNRNGGDA